MVYVVCYWPTQPCSKYVSWKLAHASLRDLMGLQFFDTAPDLPRGLSDLGAYETAAWCFKNWLFKQKHETPNSEILEDQEHIYYCFYVSGA